MSEIGDDFKEYKAWVDKRKLDYYSLAKWILSKTTFKYEIKDENRVILFREHDKLKVDYYPSTGKWKYKDRIFKGSIYKFISWYANKRSALL